MKHSLNELIIQTQTESLRKYGTEMETLVSRLEGRIARIREQQEAMIYTMKTDQEQFQSEILPSMTTLQLFQNQTVEKV